MYNIIGQKFGRLTVIQRAGVSHGEVVWHCRCDCGNEVDVLSYTLRKGKTKSCGCYKRERSSEVNIKHGLYYTRLHRIYTNMLSRCTNPKVDSYKYCGGKGLSVCDEWMGPDGLANFASWSYANGYEDHLSIDRIDNDKGYSPENCRWVTMKEQQNNRSNNHLISFNDETLTIAQWAEKLGIHYSTLHQNLKKNLISGISEPETIRRYLER